MRFSIIFLAATAGLVAAQTNTTDAAGQCIQTCFNKVDQDNPNSPDIKKCTAIADGLAQLLCLCTSAPLVDAFSTCAGQTCPDLKAQVNGTVICNGSAPGASNTTSGAGPSNSTSGAPADGTPAPSSGGNDAGNGAGTQGAAMLHIVFGGAAVVLASGLLI